MQMPQNDCADDANDDDGNVRRRNGVEKKRQEEKKESWFHYFFFIFLLLSFLIEKIIHFLNKILSPSLHIPILHLERRG